MPGTWKAPINGIAAYTVSWDQVKALRDTLLVRKSDGCLEFLDTRGPVMSWGVALPPSHISSSAPGPARPIHLVRSLLPESSERNAFLTALAQERRWFFGSD